MVLLPRKKPADRTQIIVTKRAHLYLIYLRKALIFLLCCYTVGAEGQDLGNIGRQQPFTFHGSVGVTTNFYTSNEPVSTQPPFAWGLYGNFTPTLYGIALPFSFVINQYSNSYTSPFTQFGISPSYKWIKLHLGYRTMQFSPLTFDGQSFRGAGIELTPGKFRFGAFYGKLNKAVNEDTTSGRYAMPQYSRKAYGVKAGVGTESTHFDLIWFHAIDDSSSAMVINKLQNARPQENAVLGASLRIAFTRRLIWTADVAISGLTQDLGADKVSIDTTSKLVEMAGKLFPYNASSVAAWAGQTTLALHLKHMNTTLGYRRVEPDFKSLGTPYMLNDIQMLSLSNTLALAKGKLNINTHLAQQHNNLNRKLMSELETFTGNIGVNALLSRHFNLNVSASGYTMLQKDGTAHIRDSARLDQQILQLSLMPVYNFIKGTQTHSISGNINYSLLHDRNVVTAPSNASKNMSASLTYGWYLTERSLNMSLSGLYNNYTQANNSYSSVGINLGAGAQMLKEKNLSLQGTVGYLFNHYTLGEAKGNITFSANVNYHVKHHSLGLFANYVITPANKIISAINKLPYAVTTNNLAGGVSYNYSF